MEVKELEIPVPWGHIAVQLVGDVTSEPVLCVHGIFDNIGTFERLLPHLPKQYLYICIELPSHGKSSPWPEYSIIHTTDNLLVYKIVVDYFKYGQYIIMGHSYGGQLGIMFSQIYPEHVKKLIMLETIYILPIPTGYFTTWAKSLHIDYLTFINKLKTSSPPEFTYDEAVDRVQKNRSYGEITREAAEALVKRAMVPTKNGKYIISGDQRLKFFRRPPMDLRYVSELLKRAPVKCPVLIILGSESKMQRFIMKKLLAEFRSLKNFRIVIVEGNHDVHNVTPTNVAPHINKFLNYKSSKL